MHITIPGVDCSNRKGFCLAAAPAVLQVSAGGIQGMRLQDEAWLAPVASLAAHL